MKFRICFFAFLCALQLKLAFYAWATYQNQWDEDILDRETVDQAILDINLGDETNLGIAIVLGSSIDPVLLYKRLRRRGKARQGKARQGANLAGNVAVRKLYGRYDIYGAITTVLGLNLPSNLTPAS